MPEQCDPKAPRLNPPGQKVYHCDFCGAEMMNLHCKARCVTCGFVRDCSDP